MTGGGSAPSEVNLLQDKMVGIIGPASVQGIPGGLDNCLDTYGEIDDASSYFFPNFTFNNSLKGKNVFITLLLCK